MAVTPTWLGEGSEEHEELRQAEREPDSAERSCPRATDMVSHGGGGPCHTGKHGADLRQASGSGRRASVRIASRHAGAKATPPRWWALTFFTDGRWIGAFVGLVVVGLGAAFRRISSCHAPIATLSRLGPQLFPDPDQPATSQQHVLGFVGAGRSLSRAGRCRDDSAVVRVLATAHAVERTTTTTAAQALL